MKKAVLFLRKYLSVFFLVSLALLAVCYILLGIASSGTAAADALNGSICHVIRRVSAGVTSLFPFSFGEWVLYLVPTIILFLILVCFLRCPTHASRIRLLSGIVAVILCICSLHILTLGIAYRTTTLDKKLSLSREKVTEQDLRHTLDILTKETTSLLDFVTFDENGSSVMPYSLDEMSRKIVAAYDNFAEETGIVKNFDSRVKGITASEFMSYAHLLGVYSFYTGESNLNVDYPDYNFPYTTAHEFAHQRGYIREEEANFLAFLVCLRSDDVYIRYSAYSNLLVYVMNAYYTAAGTDKYTEYYRTLDRRIVGEYRAESLHSRKYAGTAFGQASQNFNDAYLKFNGTEGAVSYGFVVDLAVAYYKER